MTVYIHVQSDPGDAKKNTVTDARTQTMDGRDNTASGNSRCD